MFGASHDPAAVPTRLRSLAAVLSLAFLFLWIFPYHARVNNPNENVRIYMTVAIVDDHTFAINRIERDWGYTNDKAVRDGKLYSSKAPGASYLGVPAYWLLTRLTHRNSLSLTPQQIIQHHAPPIDRTLVVYWLRLFSVVLPSLVFAWFWHRFLGRYTRVAALRESVFYSTMVGSQLFAYSEVFTSHALNAFATMGALMALAVLRERDRDANDGRWSLGLMTVAGLLGASATMFEYPAGIASAGVAMLILATSVERRAALAFAAMPLLGAAGLCVVRHKLPLAAGFGVAAVAAFLATQTSRSIARLAMAGVGGALPVALTLFFHHRCFGSAFTPGYSFLENPEFHATTSQGFYGATAFSWEAGVRLWLDPSFGMIPSTMILIAAVPGAASWLGLRLRPRLAIPLATVFLLIAGASMLRAVPALVKLSTDGWTGPALTDVSSLGLALAGLLAALSVLLPRPIRNDSGLGATMLLIVHGLSRLIGMMNNWRGGWTVGPRYLATLVPIVGLMALVGLDGFAQGSTLRRRLVTVFAAAATVQAMLVSGLQAVMFPHVPEAFASPLFELCLPLLRSGWVPHNAGRYLLHWEGLKSMAPFFVGALLIAAVVLRGDERRPLSTVAHTLFATALSFVLLAPSAVSVRPSNEEQLRYVRAVFEPERVAPRAVSRSVPESPSASRQRAVELLEAGNANGALEVYRHAAQNAHSNRTSSSHN